MQDTNSPTSPAFPEITDVPLSLLDIGDGRRIAVRDRRAAKGLPTVMFLPGYASDMDGTKAVATDHFCASRGIGCLRLDYSGTGSSAGEFAEGTLARWLDEVLAAIDLAVLDGPLVLAGSSMGGWLAILAAQRRPQVKAVLGIAAAPDFTNWGYTTDEKMTLLRDGKFERPNPYSPEPSVTHKAFWESGEALRVLSGHIDLTIPVRLVHGINDEEVPIGVPLKLIEQLRSADVQLRLVKGGGHRLSQPHELHAMLVELHGLLELVVR